MANNRHRLVARLRAKEEKRKLKAMTPLERFVYGAKQIASNMRDVAISLANIFKQGEMK